MKIIAVSDLHGNLVDIHDSCDVFIIAGDWSPLNIQWSYKDVIEWIDSSFMPWLLSINAHHYVFIPGNHDIVCTSSRFLKDFSSILNKYHAKHIVHYLNRTSVTIMHKKIYGIPDCEMTQTHWAFTKIGNIDWSFDNDTDILITHQPPKLSKVATVDWYGRDFGSIDLLNRLKKSHVQLNICGHIHEGEHGKHSLARLDGSTDVYNVSLLDEEYKVRYAPTIIDLD